MNARATVDGGSREAPPLSSLRSPSVLTPGEAVARAIAENAISTLVARPLPLRGVVVGPAGSGKTLAAAALREELTARGVVIADRLDAPPGHLVIVDDAHTLDASALAEVARRADDAAASLLVVYRPHPSSPRLHEIAVTLEHACPPVLLGEVTSAQIVESTHLSPACADAVVKATGARSWLTFAAIDAHDVGACEVDPRHHDIDHVLEPLIAHRLDHLDPAARVAVETLCVFSPGTLLSREPTNITWEEAIAAGSAAGLLGPNGQPPAAVRSAVRALIPVHRLSELLADGDADDEDDGWGRERTLAGRLLARGDSIRSRDPARAFALYRAALAAGADVATLGIRRGIALFGSGDLDAASAVFDRLLARADHADRTTAADATLAVWSARAALQASPDAGEQAHSPVSAARNSLASLGTGRPLPVRTDAATAHDTLSIAAAALFSALAASVGADGEGAVDDLLLASELYNATHDDFPLVEPPAVVAAAAALATGRPRDAAMVLDSALRAQQCGAWAFPRLHLWAAWTAIQGARVDAARAHMDSAAERGVPSPRDRLILAACETALARRYAPTAALATAFRNSVPHVTHRRFDLFLHPFLGELLLAAERVGTTSALPREFDTALRTLAASGDPVVWSPMMHWVGIQRAILLGRPETAAPHAKALLTAAERSPFAAQLAAAGRTWTAVLAGHVDGTAVDAAAQGLAEVGLAWDGARLAAHAAGQTTDRALAASLLARARDLHPRQSTHTDSVRTTRLAVMADGTSLSSREIEVARLVMLGRTYVEIGRALFISPRTAEHHIARIRRRLDATSRSDLLTRLRDVLGDDDADDKHPT